MPPWKRQAFPTGCRARQRLLHTLPGCLQESIVPGSVRELQVHVAPLLPEGKVVRAMDGEGEDRGIPGEYGGGSVSLVNVQIQNGHPVGLSLPLESPCRHGHVFEDAKPFPTVRKGVVRPPREVHRDTVSQSRLSGL